MTIRVLLADDEPLVRSGIGAILGAEPDLAVVGEAESGAEAVALARALAPDVVLMDVRMPGLDGIQATARILANAEDAARSAGGGGGARSVGAGSGAGGLRAPRIVVVTTFENDDYVYDALRAGACGFLLKRARTAEIVQAVRLAAVGDTLMFPAAVRSLALERRERVGTAAWTGRLTEREQEVLRLMAAGLSNAEIAGRLTLGAETVKTHVGNVLAKLGARDRTQAVVAAYESGFVVPG